MGSFNQLFISSLSRSVPVFSCRTFLQTKQLVDIGGFLNSETLYSFWVGDLFPAKCGKTWTLFTRRIQVCATCLAAISMHIPKKKVQIVPRACDASRTLKQRQVASAVIHSCTNFAKKKKKKKSAAH